MSGFLVGSGMIRLFVESDNCVAFFPSSVKRTVDDVLIVGNDCNQGPFETLTKLSTRAELHQEFGDQRESFSWSYCDGVLANSYGGAIIYYRTDKSLWHALDAIAESDYPYADELKKILKDVRS